MILKISNSPDKIRVKSSSSLCTLLLSAVLTLPFGTAQPQHQSLSMNSAFRPSGGHSMNSAFSPKCLYDQFCASGPPALWEIEKGIPSSRHFIDICQKIAIITKQIYSNRCLALWKGAMQGRHNWMWQVCLSLFIYLPINIPYFLIVFLLWRVRTQPSLPSLQLPTWLYHDSADLGNFKEQSYTLSSSRSHRCYLLWRYCSPSPLLLSSLSQQCLSFHSDKADSTKVLFCNYS